jgi:hypothetical protein
MMKQITLVFIRFSSHRARSYGLRALNRTPIAYFSLRRETGPGGVYRVSEDEVEVMRTSSKHARFSRLRGPFDDLSPCWQFD